VALRLVDHPVVHDALAALERHHPDVVVYTPVVDPELNERKFIVPSPGDFGDRRSGTV
jgi:uracil phosphoribosyltransferase